MKLNKILVFVVILSILATVFVYGSLPERIPTNFSFNGEINNYSHRSSVFITAILPLIIYILMGILPKIDPKKDSYLKHKKAYDITKYIIVSFIIIIHWTSILYSLGFNINIGVFVRVFIGIMFIVIGNYMNQIRHNYFFGIRTPWTLANEIVWKKTHRVAGFSFMAGGIILMASIFLNGVGTIIAFIAAISISALYPIIYSYIEYRKISKA